MPSTTVTCWQKAIMMTSLKKQPEPPPKKEKALPVPEDGRELRLQSKRLSKFVSIRRESPTASRTPSRNPHTASPTWTVARVQRQALLPRSRRTHPADWHEMRAAARLSFEDRRALRHLPFRVVALKYGVDTARNTVGVTYH